MSNIREIDLVEAWGAIRSEVPEELWHLLEGKPGRALKVATDPDFRAYFIESEQKKTTLEHESYTDHLTGLGNQRYFEDAFRSELSRAQRFNIPLTLELGDLDGLKKVNDTLGHGKGDKVLAELGNIYRRVRAYDKAFRIGGDETAVLLPGTDISGGVRAAKRFYDHFMEAFQDYREKTGLSISIGLACYEPVSGMPDAEGLKKYADDAMYTAKATKKDPDRTGIWVWKDGEVIDSREIL